MAKSEGAFTGEFSPSDIELVSGVSTGLQREWRRQEILPRKSDRGWTRATFEELVLIFVLKKLADAGFPLREAHAAATEAVAPVMGYVAQLVLEGRDNWFQSKLVEENKWSKYENPTAVARGEFSSKKPLVASIRSLSDDKKLRNAAYLIFPRPDKPDEGNPVHIIPVANLSEVPDDLITWTTLDNRRAAETIVSAVRKRLAPLRDQP
ncbi:hypothetical protein [Mesorhizobium sp. M0674]|uniref:hypothetical protein n=1 Tax=unclassified Mesorhizobium TaxID=325217 RepID=UPI0033361885